MYRLIVLFTILFLTNFSLKAFQIQDESLPPIILILDGSGSMWGQIDNVTKIEIARNVVGNVLDDMDPMRPVGLVAYGHRRKGDCEDIETLHDPNLKNREELKITLEKINPVGKTPLAASVMQVIDKLKASNTKATIILVSDGVESCGGDLCALVKAAKEAGVDFVLHIVGFEIGETDKLALECAAREGKGIYFDAADGEELSAALEQATELTVESTEATLSVQVTKDGSLHDAAVRVYKENEDAYFTSLRTYNHDESNPAIFHIPPGNYDIHVLPLGTDANEIWKRNIVVPGDSVKQVEIDFTAGKVSILTTANGVLWDCVVNITKAGDNKSVSGGRTYKSSSSNPMIKELTPGFYDVSISPTKLNGDSIKRFYPNVEILPGITTELSLNYRYGELSVFASNNGELWDCVLNIFRTGDKGKKSVGGGRTYNSAKHNPSIDLLTPGNYSVEYRAHHVHGNGWSHIVENQVVTEGETTDTRYDFKTGIALIGVTKDGELWQSDITLYQDGVSVYSKRARPDPKHNPKEIILTEGVYEVSVKPYQLDVPPKKFTLTIIAGETVRKNVEF